MPTPTAVSLTVSVLTCVIAARTPTTERLTVGVVPQPHRAQQRISHALVVHVAGAWSAGLASAGSGWTCADAVVASVRLMAKAERAPSLPCIGAMISRHADRGTRIEGRAIR